MYSIHTGKSVVEVTEVKTLPKTLRLLALKIKGSKREAPHPESKVLRDDQLLLRTVGLTVYPEYLAMSDDEWSQLTSCTYKPVWEGLTLSQPTPIQVGPLKLHSLTGKAYYASVTQSDLEMYLELDQSRWVGRVTKNGYTVASTDPRPSSNEAVTLLEASLRTVLNEMRPEWESLLAWAAQPSNPSVPAL